MTNNYQITVEPSARISEKRKNEFKELFLSCYKDLYYYGLKLSGSEELTKDCMQDLFVQFWSDEKALAEVKSVKAYIIKCYRRRIIAQLTEGKKKIEKFESSLIAKNRHLVTEPLENEWIENETKRIIFNKLSEAKKHLSNRQLEVLYLKFNLGYDYSTICDIMEIKYQSVRNLLSEAVKLLREKIEAQA